MERRLETQAHGRRRSRVVALASKLWHVRSIITLSLPCRVCVLNTRQTGPRLQLHVERDGCAFSDLDALAFDTEKSNPTVGTVQHQDLGRNMIG